MLIEIFGLVIEIGDVREINGKLLRRYVVAANYTPESNYYDYYLYLILLYKFHSEGSYGIRLKFYNNLDARKLLTL